MARLFCRQVSQWFCTLVFLIAPASSYAGFIFTDAQNDLFDNGFSNLDITSVEVSHDTTNIEFKITTRGFATWTKYMVAIDHTTGTGASTGNGWGRPINMSGIDSWIGSWVDQPSSNVQTWQYNGASWNQGSTIFSNSVAGNTVTISTTLASLGIDFGDTIRFDVFTSGGGGGDSAIDAVSQNTQTVSTWGDTFNSSSSKFYSVPEPTSLSLLFLTALAAMTGYRRRVR